MFNKTFPLNVTKVIGNHLYEPIENNFKILYLNCKTFSLNINNKWYSLEKITFFSIEICYLCFMFNESWTSFVAKVQWNMEYNNFFITKCQPSIEIVSQCNHSMANVVLALWTTVPCDNIFHWRSALGGNNVPLLFSQVFRVTMLRRVNHF